MQGFGIHGRDGGKIYADFADAMASPPACIMPQWVTHLLDPLPWENGGCHG